MVNHWPELRGLLLPQLSLYPVKLLPLLPNELLIPEQPGRATRRRDMIALMNLAWLTSNSLYTRGSSTGCGRAARPRLSKALLYASSWFQTAQ